MTASVKSLGIDLLPRDEQLALVQEIWDAIAAQPGSLLSDPEHRELERRVAEDDAHPEDVIGWDEVKSQTLGRLKKS